MVDARERSGATALCGTFTLIPDLGARNGFCMGRHGEPCEWTQWSLRSDGLTRVVYPDPPVRSESGVWNDMRSAANERNGKGRSYGLTRVEYPDPRSRSEKRGLERHGKACVVDVMEESELRPFAQPRHLGARSEVWNDMRSSAWWTKKEEKKRSDTLARVIYPAPRSRSEKGDLERQEELGSRRRIGVTVAWDNSYYLKWSCNQQTRNKQKRKEKKKRKTP